MTRSLLVVLSITLALVGVAWFALRAADPEPTRGWSETEASSPSGPVEGPSVRLPETNAATTERQEVPAEEEVVTDVAEPVQIDSRPVLRVLDRETSVDLRGVTVLVTTQWGHDGEVAPDPDDPSLTMVAEGAASPISLPVGSGIRHYWVHANGYAWGRIRFDHASPGERILRLDRAARLLVHLIDPPPRRFWLRLVATGHTGTRVAVDGESVARFDDLPPGEMELTAEVGPAEGETVKIGRADVTLIAGQETVLTLACSRLPDEEAIVPVAGTLELPASAPPSDLQLMIGLEGKPLVTEDRVFSTPVDRLVVVSASKYYWDAGQLVPGRYREPGNSDRTRWLRRFRTPRIQRQSSDRLGRAGAA